MLKCNSNKVAHSLIYPLKTSEKLMFSGDIEVRNFIEIALWHECSPVNLLHIFRAPFPKNTSGRLPLKFPKIFKKEAIWPGKSIDDLHGFYSEFSDAFMTVVFQDNKLLDQEFWVY